MSKYIFESWNSGVYVGSSGSTEFSFVVQDTSAKKKNRYKRVFFIGGCAQFQGKLYPTTSAKVPKYILSDALKAMDTVNFYYYERDRDGNMRKTELRYCDTQYLPQEIMSIKRILEKCIKESK